MNELALRTGIIATAVRMNERRINSGKSGNVSARTETGFLITPTGLPYESMRPEDIVAVTLAGAASGPRLPSSEWRFHRDIYVDRADAGAIVHARRSGNIAARLSAVARQMPRSVMSPVTSRAGVTSKAGFITGVPGGATASPPPS